MNDGLALRVAYALSRVIFFILFSLLGLRRAVIRDNLARSFPELDPAGSAETAPGVPAPAIRARRRGAARAPHRSRRASRARHARKPGGARVRDRASAGDPGGIAHGQLRMGATPSVARARRSAARALQADAQRTRRALVSSHALTLRGTSGPGKIRAGAARAVPQRIGDRHHRRPGATHEPGAALDRLSRPADRVLHGRRDARARAAVAGAVRRFATRGAWPLRAATSFRSTSRRSASRSAW